MTDKQDDRINKSNNWEKAWNIKSERKGKDNWRDLDL